MRFALFRVKKDQVNVRRNIQLAATQFAHGDDGQLHRTAIRINWLTKTCCEIVSVKLQGGVDCGFGKVRKGAGDFMEVRHARQITCSGDGPDPIPQLPHSAI
jgi:hypothetical protein